MAKQDTRVKHRNRIKSYKQLTGRQRISKEVREALKEFTPSEVIRSQKIGQKTYARRLNTYREKYGNLDNDIERLLKYGTVSKVKRITEKKESPEKKGEITKKAKIKEERVKLGFIEYDDFPNTIKNWSHLQGNWLYNAEAWYTNFDLDSIADKTIIYGDGSRDHDDFDFLIEVVQKKKPGVRLIEYEEDGITKMRAVK